MMGNIFLRILYDKRWFTLGWSLSLGFMAVLVIAMYPSLQDGMESIAASMPRELQGLIGDIASFAHLDTYLSSQLYDIRAPLFFMIMAVVLAQNLSAGAEERGELRTLLSTATSRTSLFLQTCAAVGVIFIAAVAIMSGFLWVTAPFINESLDALFVLKLGGLSLLFAMVLFAITYGAGMLSGSRTLVNAIGIGIIISSIVLEAGRAVDWLEPAQYVSLLHYYDAGKLLTSGLDINHVLVQLALLIGALLLGWLRFRQRDIG